MPIRARVRSTLAVLALLGVTLVVPSGVAWAAGHHKHKHSAPNAAKFDLVSPGTLTVANFGTQHPTVVVKNGKMTGIDGYFLNAFAKRYHLKLKLFDTTFASTLLAVEQHRADVAVTMFWNATRGKQLRFGTPYYAAYSVIIVNKHAIPNYKGPNSLAGKKIGEIVGTVYTPIAQKYFPASNLVIYPGLAQAGSALISGKIDAMIEASSTFLSPPFYGAKGLASFPIKPGQYGMHSTSLSFPASDVVACTNAPLDRALNNELRHLEKSGKWAKVMRKNTPRAKNSKVPYKRYPAPKGGCNG